MVVLGLFIASLKTYLRLYCRVVGKHSPSDLFIAIVWGEVNCEYKTTGEAEEIIADI